MDFLRRTCGIRNEELRNMCGLAKELNERVGECVLWRCGHVKIDEVVKIVWQSNRFRGGPRCK